MNYYQKNKDRILLWREQNKDRIKKYNEEYNTFITCNVCMRKLKKTSMYSHEKTRHHLLNLHIDN